MGGRTVHKIQQGATGPRRGIPDAFGSRHGGSHLPYESHPILNRGPEHDRVYFRCGRYFTVGHEWYVTLREEKDIGPYASRDEAELALACHVTACFLAAGHIGQLDAHGGRDATVLEVLVQELASCQEQARLRNENSAYVWAQQRLDEFAEHPEKYGYVDTRVKALRHFLSELDS